MDKTSEMWIRAEALAARKKAMEAEGVHGPKSEPAVALEKDIAVFLPKFATWLRANYRIDEMMDEYIRENILDFAGARIDSNTMADHFYEMPLDDGDTGVEYGNYLRYILVGENKKLFDDLNIIDVYFEERLGGVLTQQYLDAAAAAKREWFVDHVELAESANLPAYYGILTVTSGAVVNIGVMHGVLDVKRGCSVAVGIMHGTVCGDGIVTYAQKTIYEANLKGRKTAGAKKTAEELGSVALPIRVPPDSSDLPAILPKKRSQIITLTEDGITTTIPHKRARKSQ